MFLFIPLVLLIYMPWSLRLHAHILWSNSWHISLTLSFSNFLHFTVLDIPFAVSQNSKSQFCVVKLLINFKCSSVCQIRLSRENAIYNIQICLIRKKSKKNTIIFFCLQLNSLFYPISLIDFSISFCSLIISWFLKRSFSTIKVRTRQLGQFRHVR